MDYRRAMKTEKSKFQKELEKMVFNKNCGYHSYWLSVFFGCYHYH